MVIHTPDYRLRVFVSSTLKELSEERKVVRQTILKLSLAPVMFESGARPHPAQELYQSYLSQSHIFVGIYWQSYGWVAPDKHISGIEDEYNLSSKIPRLIYIKNPAPEREPALSSLLDRIRQDNTSSYTYFSTPAQLKELVQNDLALMLTERFEAANQPERPVEKPQINHPTNIPIPRNPLIGRERELSTVCDMLQRDDIALITLTGPGGTGKSRLAIQIGLESLKLFPEGVYLVGLETINDTHLVVPAIADAVGLHESPGSRPVKEMLTEYLHDRRALLILDNFEQVVEAAPCVTELLEACPRLKCIVTSRTPLRLRAEKEIPIPPLKYPDSHPISDPVGLSHYAAVELFTQRAQAIKPDFSLTEVNAPAIAEICQRLDGLPLAIELAAPRIKLLTPQGLLSRLEHRFDLLTGGTRDLPERQRTLRGAIDWSYNLLNEVEKTVFKRLAVFTGSWTLATVEMVLDINGDLAHKTDDALDALINNNMVLQVPDTGEEPRFGMLSTIRDYALEKLGEGEESDTVHRQQARFYVDFVARVEPLIRSSERVKWQQVMQAEYSNIRGVLEWVSKVGKYAELGQQIVITLGIYWQICGYIAEGQQWCSRMLALCNDSTSSSIRAGLLCLTGLFARNQADQLAAIETIDKSLELSNRQDDKRIIGTALFVKGMIASATRDIDTAAKSFQQAVELFKSTNDLWYQAVGLSWLGDVAQYANDHERAQALHEESIRLARKQGDPWCLMPALMSSAQTDILSGEIDQAYPKLIEIIDVLHKTGDLWSLAWTLLDLGHVLRLRGDIHQAADNLLEGLSLASSYGNLGAEVVTLAEIGAIVSNLARQDEQRLSTAARLCGTTASYLETPGLFIWINTRHLYDDAISQAKSMMSDQLWNRGYSEGQGLTIDQAVDLAVSALKPNSNPVA